MGDRLDQLLAAETVLERPFQVKGQFVDTVERNETRHRDEAAVTRRKAWPFPHVAEQHFVSVVGEAGRNVCKWVTRGGWFAWHDDLLRLVKRPSAAALAVRTNRLGDQPARAG